MEHRAAIRMAEVMIGGEWTVPAVVDRIRTAIGPHAKRSKWPLKLAERIFEEIRFSRTAPNNKDLARFLVFDSQARKIADRADVSIAQWAANAKPSRKPKPQMQPRGEHAATWQIPSILTTTQLAERMEISTSRLDWLADLRASEYDVEAEKLRNYRYQWIRKSSGGMRLLEAPKQSLKRCQRWIADNILKHIPTHQAAHAFCSGRSPLTAAIPHTNQHVVLRIDLCDFFPSISAARIAGVFRTAGYPSQVVNRLTGLCTNTTWRGVLDEVFAADQFNGFRRAPESTYLRDPRFAKLFQPHLPQGSPSSPMLANLCAWSLDCRLTGLAEKFRATYTRYADDLIFSGDKAFGNQLRQFRIMACAICIDEGFEIRKRKTTISREHQQQKVTGVVVNRKPAIARKEYDRLKAILHNCVQRGPESQNRDHHADFRSHLTGKVAWVRMIDATKGDKLQSALDAISWTNQNQNGWPGLE